MLSRGEAGEVSKSSRAEQHVASEEVMRDFPKLLERIPAIVYIADLGPDGPWHYVSPQVQAILGFSPAELRADPALWRSRLHPDDRDRVLIEESDTDEEGMDGPPTEYRLFHRDGSIVWLADQAMLVRDGDGLMRWHGVMSDITARKQAEAEAERRAAQQSAVAQLGEHALEGASTSDLMHEAVQAAALLLGVDLVCVAELLADEDSFAIRADFCAPGMTLGKGRFPAGVASQAGYTVLTGKPVVVSDWRREKRFSMSPLIQGMGIRSGLSVMIEGRSEPFGVLAVQSQSTRIYGPGDIDYLQSLANVLADALERHAIEDGIRHRALHDPLSGLPNRVLFLDRLEHALARVGRRGSMAAILFLDLDHFKLVNDSLGHHVGDELLTATAPRLRQAVRTTDTVARFGGDEFGILLEDIAGEQDAVEMAERIAATFTRPFVLAGNEHFVTASVGIAIARGGEIAQELIRDADAAMYRAKERGRARYELFDEVMRGRAIARLRVENDLRRALERGELRLDYQPVVSLRDHSIVSVEALVRWDHPDRGVVAPSEFIHVAEENGMIEQIGRWVLDRACRQAARWCSLRPDSAPIGISVNLSAVQVGKRDLPDMVATVLRATGLDPACLSLEITETVMLRDVETLTEVLRALKAIGVGLALDDFGTAYSSLGYLTHLPLDALKIDRSFVDGLGTERRDTAITEAIIAMSRALSLNVIAEGVETQLQVDELVRLGCQLAQGFYFSRPVAAREITSILREGPAWTTATPDR
jgi:diguanylate cyclase (GGDEF)-like protein/PAS domain S-box-containing protein